MDTHARVCTHAQAAEEASQAADREDTGTATELGDYIRINEFTVWVQFRLKVKVRVWAMPMSTITNIRQRGITVAITFTNAPPFKKKIHRRESDRAPIIHD